MWIEINVQIRKKSSDVRISPLMCFVGDNNSGKSYLMSLLWGILTLGKDIFPKIPSESKVYKKCENWLNENINQNKGLSNEEIELYVSWFNELLTNNKKSLLNKIFNYEVDAEKIQIMKYHRKKKFEVCWERVAERYSVTESYVKFPTQETYNREQIKRFLYM